jgi:uncharacterized protein (TIGR02453 family)
MMMDEQPFLGFPDQGLKFLTGLKKNNNKAWFDEHKETYKEELIAPGQAFVVALGRKLQKISKGVIYDTRLNGSGSIMRIYRDIRFSKDKTPYKDWMGIIWWEGKERKKMENPGYYVHVDPKETFVAAGHYHFPKQFFEAYRLAILDNRRGKELDSILAKLNRMKGVTVAGEQTKRVPRGYDADHPRAELLKYKGLYVYTDKILRKELTTPKFVDLCYKWCEKMSPLQDWMVKVAKTAR